MPSSSSPSGAAAASPASGIQSVWRRMVVLLRRWATSLIRKFMPKTPLVANAPIDASAASGSTVASATTDTTATTAAGTAEATSTDAARSSATTDTTATTAAGTAEATPTDAARSEATGTRATSETATSISNAANTASVAPRAIWSRHFSDILRTMSSSCSMAPREIAIPIGAFCSTHGFHSADLIVMKLKVVYTSDLLCLKKDDILEKIKSRSQARNIDAMLRKAYEIHGKNYRWDLVRSFDMREKDKAKSGRRGIIEKDAAVASLRSYGYGAVRELTGEPSSASSNARSTTPVGRLTPGYTPISYSRVVIPPALGSSAGNAEEVFSRNHRGSLEMDWSSVAHNNLHAPFTPVTATRTTQPMIDMQGRKHVVDPSTPLSMPAPQEAIYHAQRFLPAKTALSSRTPPSGLVSTRFAMPAKNDADAPSAVPPQTAFRQDVPASPVVAPPSRYAPFGERGVRGAYIAGPGTSGEDLLDLARNVREGRLKSWHTDVHTAAHCIVSVEPISATLSPVVCTPPTHFSRQPVLSFRKPSQSIVAEVRNSLVSDDEEDGTSGTVRSSGYCAVAEESTSLSNEFAVSGRKQTSRSIRSKHDEADSDDEAAEKSEVALPSTLSRFPVVQPSLPSPSASGLSSAIGLSDGARYVVEAERGERLTAPEPMPVPVSEFMPESLSESMPVQPALVLDAEVVAWIAREKLPKELLDSLTANGVYTLQQVRDMTPEVLGLVTSGLKPLPVKRVQQTVDALRLGMTWEQHYRARTPPNRASTSPAIQHSPVVQPNLAYPSDGSVLLATGLSDVARRDSAPSLIEAERGERLTSPEPAPEATTVSMSEETIPVQATLVLDAEVADWIASEKLPSELVDSLPANGVYTLQQVRDMTPEVLGLVTSGLKPLPVKRVQQTVDALRLGMTWEQYYRARTPPNRASTSPAIQRSPVVQPNLAYPSDGSVLLATGLSDVVRRDSAPSLIEAERGERLTSPEPAPEATTVSMSEETIPVQATLVLDAEVADWIASEKLPSELVDSLPANGVYTLQQVRDMTPEVLGLVTSGLKPLPVKRVQQTVDALRLGMTWEQYYRSINPTK